MEATTLLISIGIGKTIGIIVSVSGTIIGGAWWLSGRLHTIQTKVEGFDKRLTTFEGLAAGKVFGSLSPLSLLPKGEKILEESGLKQWIDENKDALIKQCKDNGVRKNPYDIQEASFALLDTIDLGTLEKNVNNTAYENGMTVSVVRRTGGIYFRDIFLEEAGFKKDDIDKHDPDKTNEI